MDIDSDMEPDIRVAIVDYIVPKFGERFLLQFSCISTTINPCHKNYLQKTLPEEYLAVRSRIIEEAKSILDSESDQKAKGVLVVTIASAAND